MTKRNIYRDRDSGWFQVIRETQIHINICKTRIKRGEREREVVVIIINKIGFIY